MCKSRGEQKTPATKTSPLAVMHGKGLISRDLFLTNLIANRTGCFTGRLTRSLAFAAAAGMYGFLQGSGIDSNNMFHIHLFPP